MNHSGPRYHPGGGAPGAPSTKLIFSTAARISRRLTLLTVDGKSKTRNSGNAQKASPLHARPPPYYLRRSPENCRIEPLRGRYAPLPDLSLSVNARLSD